MSILKGIDLIRRWVIQTRLKEQTKEGGVMITLPDKSFVDLNTSITADRLLRSGVDINQLTSIGQVDNIINQINKPKVISQGDPKFKGIMSRMTGKNVIKADFGPGFKKEVEKMKGKVDDDLPPPGSRGGKDDIAAPVQSAEEATTNLTDSTIQSMLKMEPIEAMKEANKVIKREGIYKALDQKQAKKILDETEDHIFERNFKTPDDPDFDPESMADGGRIGFKGGADMGTVSGDTREATAKSASVSPSGSVTTSRTKGPEGPDDRASADQDMVQMLVNAGYTPKEINAITNPTVIDKVKQSRFNNPVTRGILRTGAYLYNPTLAGIDFRRAMQLKNLYDVTKDSITNPEITEEDVQFATGGRIGYKKGSVDLARRGFMKAAAGVGAGIGALKMGALKLFGKEGTRQVTKNIIKTDNVPGKPEWFDALVTKVINQGEDVTKKFATKEREIVHMKKLDEDTTVKVTQDLDNGAIRVEYDSPDNVYGDPVQLQYKKSLPDEGDPNPSAEFDVAESGPVGRSFGPDDYEIEIDEVGGTSIKDLTSDVSKLKEYAVGKKPTLKEFVQSKKRKDRAKKISEGGENEMDEVVRRQGEFIQFEDIDPNMASGGIARMLGE